MDLEKASNKVPMKIKYALEKKPTPCKYTKLEIYTMEH